MRMTIDTTIVTAHSINRAKNRHNIKNVRSTGKNIALALQRGKRAEELTSWERSYLSKEAHNGCTAVAYNNFCYIINSDGACVTLYPLPSWFGKKKHFDGKERIRKYKRYCRYNSEFAIHEWMS